MFSRMSNELVLLGFIILALTFKSELPLKVLPYTILGRTVLRLAVDLVIALD